MLDVFLTCDTEVWCDGWIDIDGQFPAAFRRYIYGPTKRGAFGLPFQIRMLREHDLRAVFFVETLFADRFGLDPLREIVEMVKAGGQEVQLHLHTEWADEGRPRLLPHVEDKRQHLRYYSAADQQTLISRGMTLLEAAGGGTAVAFRAGSFALNLDTLKALALCGIAYDTSYNASCLGDSSGVSPDRLLFDPILISEVAEYPVTVFKDGLGKLRHAQVGACSSAELEQVLWSALEGGRGAVVIVFHNFELMNEAKTACDPIVVRRFEHLCRFLARHRDCFQTKGFSGLPLMTSVQNGTPVRTSRAATARRVVEQVARRLA